MVAPNPHAYMGAHAPKNPYADVNPKDILAAAKLPLDLIPETLHIEVALAFLEGALKYGRYNWRAKPVKVSVYLSAMERHLRKYQSGEERDAKTGIRHMAYIICCASIIIDAGLYGTLRDDRPPRGPNNPQISEYIDNAQVIITHLQKMFKDERPYQYTIQDK